METEMTNLVSNSDNGQRSRVSGPGSVQRLIVHQFDPARPSPGGIDTCLRGIARYAPSDQAFAFVGVDTGQGPSTRKLGIWESYEFGPNTIWFLPVVKLDPAQQARRIPHALRLILGLLRFRRRLPSTDFVQAHRMDTAWALMKIMRARYAYFIHTQENGLTGRTSDSFWKRAGGAHRRLEKAVARRARQVVVFNDGYAEVVREWNPATIASPTWFDPELINSARSDRDPYRIVWVGRLETPKDPLLALSAFAQLISRRPAEPWSIDIIGSGTLSTSLAEKCSGLDENTRSRVSITGALPPQRVAEIMSVAGSFLMTSHPGYEGYPRVLVEAMASGLRPIVTLGSDTGNLIVNGHNGFVTNRDPGAIAEALVDSLEISRDEVVSTVTALSAPAVLDRIYRNA